MKNHHYNDNDSDPTAFKEHQSDLASREPHIISPSELEQESLLRISKSETCDLLDAAYLPTNINYFARMIHRLNHEWWINIETGQPLERDFAGLMMMAVTELSEAVEGHRKNLMDDKLPHRKMVEVEIADGIIRLLDTAAALKLDVGGAMLEKLRFNATRQDHSIQHRLSDHGKKY